MEPPSLVVHGLTPLLPVGLGGAPLPPEAVLLLALEIPRADGELVVSPSEMRLRPDEALPRRRPGAPRRVSLLTLPRVAVHEVELRTAVKVWNDIPQRVLARSAGGRCPVDGL